MKKEREIVVMGGSFDPPTSAHKMLMKEAVDTLDADIGFFVSVSSHETCRRLYHEGDSENVGSCLDGRTRLAKETIK